MAALENLFVERGRVSYRDLARFADVDIEEIAEIAEGLGLGPTVRLAEAEEIIEILADENADAAADDDDDDGDDDDGADPAEGETD